MTEWAVVENGVELMRFATADEALVTANHYNEIHGLNPGATVEPVEEE